MANKIYVNTDNTNGAAVWERFVLWSETSELYTTLNLKYRHIVVVNHPSGGWVFLGAGTNSDPVFVAADVEEP